MLKAGPASTCRLHRTGGWSTVRGIRLIWRIDEGRDVIFRRRHLPFFVARVREGVPRSPCALVSARPHPQAVAQDRRDTVARRRAALPWRACDGTRQVTCAWLRTVHRSSPCSEPTATSRVNLFSLAAEPARFDPVKSRNAAKTSG